ncbi:dephospho-CoA kinase [Spiribacter onubensis]|uniref:Dephospho-CoA kinase n=1 Tax=Spiribacter onubensis TaxID=3122420 RepID=A0ABV3S5X7_9GAMM
MTGEYSESGNRPALVVGLTGGIASGKTAVSDRFAALGAAVIDTDQLAREVVAPGTEGLAAVRERFGAAVIDARGELDRRALRERIFSDQAARRDLEAITHPRIRARVTQRLAEAEAPYAIVVVPLLVEAGWAESYDRILVVDAEPSKQRERLMARDHVDRAQADRALASQTQRERRLALADDVIVNDGTPDELDARVQTLHRQYLGMAGRAG